MPMPPFALPNELEAVRPQLEATIRPYLAVKRHAQQDNQQPWESRIGGTPYLPANESYPMGEDWDGEEKPLIFLAQINMAEAPALPDFPAEGLLQFFVDDTDVDHVATIRYYPTIMQEASQLTTDFSFLPTPEFSPLQPLDGSEPVPHRVALRLAAEAVPFNNCHFADQLGDDFFAEHFGDEADEMEQEYLDTVSAGGCKMGGYAHVPLSHFDSCDAEDAAVLLFQLDSDATMDIHWGGNGGVLSFFISPDDLQQRNFEDVQLYLYD